MERGWSGRKAAVFSARGDEVGAKRFVAVENCIVSHLASAYSVDGLLFSSSSWHDCKSVTDHDDLERRCSIFSGPVITTSKFDSLHQQGKPVGSPEMMSERCMLRVPKHCSGAKAYAIPPSGKCT